jgi:hypothetical protein
MQKVSHPSLQPPKNKLIYNQLSASFAPAILQTGILRDSVWGSCLSSCLTASLTTRGFLLFLWGVYTEFSNFVALHIEFPIANLCSGVVVGVVLASLASFVLICSSESSSCGGGAEAAR